MKEKPILFNTEMVQAILYGRKTQTRRTFKYQPFSDAEIEGPDFFNTVKYDKDGYTEEGPEVYGAWDENNDWGIKSPCQPGDILWVRETFAPIDYGHNLTRYAFKADGSIIWNYFKWKPSIHMPKDAARIWLKVTDVRCERLKDISEDDAWSEGVKGKGITRYEGESIQLFQSLWQSIHGPDSWNENPWVWVYEFEVVSTNGKMQQQSNSNAIA